MAYVVLAVGVLMAVAGAYAAVTGYSIVQVEQGWSSVIAGATLTAGGIITVALGFVLRALQGLRDVLAEPKAVISPEAPVMPELAIASPAPAEIAAPEPHDAFAAPPQKDRGNLFGAPPTPDDYKLETPSTAEHDLVQPAPPSPSLRPARSPQKSVPADDWLDRAFAEFDQEATEPAASRTLHIEPRAAEPVAPPALVAPPAAAQPVIAAPVPRPAETTPPEPMPAEAAAEDAESAVIGRYEADGTSYVMYADGSIEAQTYSGVYRFASMAELKAFIES